MIGSALDENFWFQIDSEMIKKIQQGVYYQFSIIPGFEPIKIDQSIWDKYNYNDYAMAWKLQQFKSHDTLDKLKWMYRHHIISHAVYYTSMPEYYLRLLTILN